MFALLMLFMTILNVVCVVWVIESRLPRFLIFVFVGSGLMTFVGFVSQIQS